MRLLIYTFLLPLCATLNTPREVEMQQEPEVEVSDFELLEEDVAANVIYVQETEDFTLDEEGERLLHDAESDGADLLLHPEVDVDTPTDQPIHLVKRNAPSNLEGIPWLDACGQAMPITPQALADGRTYHYAVAYNEISNEYLLVFDFDWNFDLKPDRIFATRRNVFCHNDEFTTKGNMHEITIRAGKSQGWPDIAYNSDENEYLIVFQVQLSTGWVIAGQRISAIPDKMSREVGPFIALSIRDSRSRRLSTTALCVVYVPDTRLYMVAGTINITTGYKMLYVNCIMASNRLAGRARLFPFRLFIYKPRLVYDPVNKRVYVITRASRSILDQRGIVIPSSVSIGVNDTYVLVYVIVSGRCVQVSESVTVIGTTDVRSARIEATWNVKEEVVICIWDSKDANGNLVLNSVILDGETVKKASGKFNSLDDYPVTHATVTYYPPYEVPVVMWQEQFRSQWYLGGSLLLAGSVAMFTTGQHQSLPTIMYVSGGESSKLIVVWRQHVRYDIRMFAQCICESETGIPPEAQDLIIGRRGLFYWLPTEEEGIVSAIARNEIPNPGLMDYNVVNDRMAFYNPPDRTIRSSNLIGQNQSVRVTDVDRPGTIVGDFERNRFFYTNPNDITVVMVQDEGTDVKKTVVTDLQNPDSLAVQGNTLVFSGQPGDIHYTVIGSKDDDGNKLLFSSHDTDSTDDVDNNLVREGNFTVPGSDNDDEGDQLKDLVGPTNITVDDRLIRDNHTVVGSITPVPGTNDFVYHYNNSIHHLHVPNSLIAEGAGNIAVGTDGPGDLIFQVPTTSSSTTMGVTTPAPGSDNDDFPPTKTNQHDDKNNGRPRVLGPDVKNDTSIPASTDSTIQASGSDHFKNKTDHCLDKVSGVAKPLVSDVENPASNDSTIQAPGSDDCRNESLGKDKGVARPLAPDGKDVGSISNNKAYAQEVVKDVKRVSSIAASKNKTCYHDDDKSKIICVSNDSDSKVNVRERAPGGSKLHFTQDESSNESDPCKKPLNGGCEHFCLKEGDGRRCYCKDGYITKGNHCLPIEPCPIKCPSLRFSSIDFCQMTKATNAFVFIGKAGGSLEKDNKVRYTVTQVKILHGKSVLSRKTLYKDNKSLRVWLHMPICCPTPKQKHMYAFIGRTNKDKQLVIPKKNGQVWEWNQKWEEPVKKELEKCLKKTD